MTHSRMLATRRKKQKIKKRLAKQAKKAKKLTRQTLAADARADR